MSFITYNANIPNPPDDPGDDVTIMQRNSSGISQWTEVDHVGFNDPDGGLHQQVTFDMANAASTSPQKSVIFTGKASPAPAINLDQLFYYPALSVPSQSSGQYTYGNVPSFPGPGTSMGGSTYLMGGFILKWGTLSAAANNGTYNFVSPFINNCFSVVVSININSTPTVIGVNGFTNNGFTFKSTLSTNVPITYFAIGN